MIALVLWAACTPAPTVLTTELPDARVGELYSTAIEVAEGREPLTYAAGGLPVPLAMNPLLGIVSGVPREVGTFEVTLEVHDKRGERGEVTLPLTVEASREGCGRTLRGEITEEGGFFDVDWEARGSWATRQMGVPPDTIDRVTFEPSSNITMRLVHPGLELVPEGDVEAQAEFIGGNFSTGLAQDLDHRTRPNLGAYQVVRGDATLLVTAPFGATDWEVQTTCTPGPIVEPAILGPFRAGDLVRSGFRDIEPQAETRMEALDALPAGLELSEAGGLSGSPTTQGEFEFRLRSTRPDGAERESAHGVSVYEPVVVGCGETVPFATRKGLFEDDGDAFGQAEDVDGFAVIETPWAGHAALTYTFTFDDAPGAIRAMDPNRAQVNPTSVVETRRGEEVTFELSPNVWPPARHYQGWSHARMVAAVDGEAASGTVSLRCDDAPRPDLVALPVLTPGVAESWALHAVGGTPPYTWSAEGLPEGITIDESGELTTDGSDFGRADVALTVRDAAGPGTTVTVPLWSSLAEACGPDATVLTCADDVTIAQGSYADDPNPWFCIAPESVLASDWMNLGVSSAAITDFEHRRFPDGEVSLDVGFFRGTTLQRGLNETWFGLEHHDGLPYAFSLSERAGEADRGWTVFLECGTGPVGASAPPR